ncbi:GAF domain-containing protein [Streptomyces sp. NPDC060184]|uniref:GAF domain-containing protein n=1 Tax=Streptomyces sp. NPDC060184 TaxID=3347064 RepID=UPI0036533F05
MSTAAEPATHSAHPFALELLQSVVDVARAIFGAQASSVFLLDEETNELVFQAVSGQGEESLVGRRFPADRGIAGWVTTSGEPMIVDRLSQNSAFDRTFAQSTRYVPDALMAVPLLHDHRTLGVLEVLDPAPQTRSSLGELELLSMFGRQAATALRLVTHHQPPGRALAPGDHVKANRLLTELQELLNAPGTH